MTKTNDGPTTRNFAQKHLLGIDFGSKVTGVALFFEGEDISPYPYKSLIYHQEKQLIDQILHIIKENSIDIVVLGVPKLLDGQETSTSKKMRQFGKKLSSSIKKLSPAIELLTHDETLSTFAAKDRMQNSPRYNFRVDLSKIDEVAASIILEDFLRAHGYQF